MMKKIDEFNAEDRIDLRLLENSTFYLNGEIDEDSVGEAIKWILYENLQGEGRVLTLYINSTGGDLYQALALIDIMRNSPHVIQTIGVGAVMSAAFLIFACGDKKHRYAASNTSFMCHQFTSGMDAKYHDLKAEMKETELLNEKMISILMETTGMPKLKVKSKLLPASDVYLTAQEVVDFSVADYII
jgi:ATP-dependent Clp endopeptidase proteolytic subunit ClpP